LEGDRGQLDHLALDVVAVVIGFVVCLVLIVIAEGHLAGGAVVLSIQRLVDLHYIIPTYTNSLIVRLCIFPSSNTLQEDKKYFVFLKDSLGR
jgi:hypothetical protein